MNNSDKTIPYKLSPAELENLRLLRKRMNPSGSIPDDESEEGTSGKVNPWNSDSGAFTPKPEKKAP